MVKLGQDPRAKRVLRYANRTAHRLIQHLFAEYPTAPASGFRDELIALGYRPRQAINAATILARVLEGEPVTMEQKVGLLLAVIDWGFDRDGIRLST